VEEGIQHNQVAQCFGLSTVGTRGNIDSFYPILSTFTYIGSGTNIGGYVKKIFTTKLEFIHNNPTEKTYLNLLNRTENQLSNACY